MYHDISWWCLLVKTNGRQVILQLAGMIGTSQSNIGDSPMVSFGHEQNIRHMTSHTAFMIFCSTSVYV